MLPRWRPGLGFGNLDQKYQLGVLLANLFTFIDLRCET